MARIGRGTALDPAPGDVYTAIDGSAWKVATSRAGLLQLRPHPRPGGRVLTITVQELLARVAGWTHTRDRDMTETIITVAGKTYVIDEISVKIEARDESTTVTTSVRAPETGVMLYEHITTFSDEFTSETLTEATRPVHEWIRACRA
ncbi:hypothetical protein ACWGOE_07370 [Leucobacter chromiiresistens]